MPSKSKCLSTQDNLSAPTPTPTPIRPSIIYNFKHARPRQCAGLPAALQSGCEFRFGAFKNADNPAVTYRRVQCPAALTDVSQCKLDDDDDFPLVIA